MYKNKVVKLIFLMFIILSFAFLCTSCSVKAKTDISKYNSYSYIASKSTKKFHTRDCYLGKRIAPEDAVFFHSRGDAINSGYKPDPVCEP